MTEVTIPVEFVGAAGVAFVAMGGFIKWLVTRLLTAFENNTKAMTELTVQIQSGGKDG